MKKRAAVYFMIMFIGLFLFINDSRAFYSIQGSLVTESLHGEKEIIIIEGIYFFVIDNTGIVSRILREMTPMSNTRFYSMQLGTKIQ